MIQRGISALTLLLAAGCGVGSQDAPQPLSSGVAGPSSASPDRGAATRVYFVHDDRLAAVPRRTAGDDRARIGALLDGVSGSEAQEGLRNALPASVGLRDVRRSGGTLTVDLTGDLGEATADEQTLAVAQIVYTATEQSGRADAAPTAVQLLVAGVPVQVPRADGSLASTNLDRADFRSESPADVLSQGDAPAVGRTDDAQ